MIKRETQPDNMPCRMTDLPGLCVYVALGRTAAQELAKKAGARKKYGRRTLYDLRLIDRFLDGLTEGE